MHMSDHIDPISIRKDRMLRISHPKRPSSGGRIGTASMIFVSPLLHRKTPMLSIRYQARVKVVCFCL